MALPPFAPYLVKTVAGVKVAVIGLTTPVIPQWEKPEHIRGLSWRDPVATVRRTLAALEAERPDVVLVAIHGGLGRDPETGAPAPYDTPGENPVWALAETFPGLTAVIFGHTHRSEPGRRVNGVLLVQPRNWAMELARVDIALERDAAGRFRVVGRRAGRAGDGQTRRTHRRLAPPTRKRPSARLTPGGRVEGRAERCAPFRDSALVDLIHEAQLHYAGAQVSFASLQAQLTVSRDR
jgi:2',3'-cyclic-nucleotide 2'-phosphodiesterase/3'-nucleotidase